jgi:RNA polymerase sigma-70 factor (ECF subfamily)
MSESGGTESLVEGLFRREAGRLAARLTRLFGPARLSLVEDVLQDTFATALARWPIDGAPDRPAAWLATVARNKALDRLRREAREQPFEEALFDARPMTEEPQADLDDTLALMFVACHPALGEEAQAMLTLKTVCGFGVNEIARAYLTSTDAVAQRLVRAKADIRKLGLTFEIPEGGALAERLPALLQAVYLLFTGGYTAGEGEDLIVAEFCVEALRLAELVTRHRATATGEAHALAALLSFQHARASARIGNSGELLRLAEQDRRLWSSDLIARGFAHLQQAMISRELSVYHVEAGAAAVHASARDFESTDWQQLAQFYAMLEELKPTPVVRLNAAVASAYGEGPQIALLKLDRLLGDRRMEDYALFHATRGDLLLKLGRSDAAQMAFRRALVCPLSDPERAFIATRAESCRHVS